MKDDDMKQSEERTDESNGAGDAKKFPEIEDTVVEENEKEGKKNFIFFGREISRGKVYGIGAGVLCAALLVGGGIALANTNGAHARNDGTGKVTQTQEKTDEKEQLVLTLNVKADGWDKDTSTLVIAHIVSEDGKVDFYHAFDVSERVEIPVGVSGSYNVTFVSIVNADGSIYKVDGTKTVTAGKAGKGSAGTNVDFKKVEAGNVTKDDLTAIAKDVAEAVKKGDSTLIGNSGVQVAKKYEDNIKNNANADAEEVAKETETAQKTAKEEKSEAKKTDASNGGADGNTGSAKSSNSSNSGNASKSDSGTNSATSSGKVNSGSNSSSSNSGSGNTKQDSTPAHQHNYNIPITKTVHHDAVYSTVHHDAQYTTVHHDAVVEYHNFCKQCGADITGNERGHMKNSAMNGGSCMNWYEVPVTVQNAYDEQVLVSNAWDEQVLVSAAWDETVTTGYKCSCGATK